MDRILIIMKKMDTRESSAPLQGLFSIICKHVYLYIQQISGERLLYRTIGPLVLIFAQKLDCGYTLELRQF